MVYFDDGCPTQYPKQQTFKHQTPNTKHQTPNTKHQTSNTKHQTPNSRYQKHKPQCLNCHGTNTRTLNGTIRCTQTNTRTLNGTIRCTQTNTHAQRNDQMYTTGMERAQGLNEARRGKIPQNFAGGAHHLKQIVERCTERSQLERPSAAEVRTL